MRLAYPEEIKIGSVEDHQSCAHLSLQKSGAPVIAGLASERSQEAELTSSMSLAASYDPGTPQ